VRWSKLKQRIEDGFAESVRGRIELHQTRYRGSHDHKGELWITLDGEHILSAASMTALNAWFKRRTALQRQGMPLLETYKQADKELEADGIAEAGLLVELLREYLNQPIEDAIGSPSPIIRGLGLLDRRFGVRRLERFDPTNEHEFVVRMFQVRCDLEGLSRRATPTNGDDRS
jgi:hypothetical protein